MLWRLHTELLGSNIDLISWHALGHVSGQRPEVLASAGLHTRTALRQHLLQTLSLQNSCVTACRMQSPMQHQWLELPHLLILLASDTSRDTVRDIGVTVSAGNQPGRRTGSARILQCFALGTLSASATGRLPG